MKIVSDYIEMKQYIADVYYYGKKKSTRKVHFYVSKDKRAYTYYPGRDLVVHYSGN